VTRRTGRPTRAAAAEIDRRIQTAAVESFVSKGFDGTTMEAVAAASGVTRRTLYAKYRDKEALFVAAVPLALATSLDGIPLEVPDGSLDEVLRSLARQIIARLVEPEAVKLRRFAMLESARLAALDEPAGVQIYFDSIRAIADVLAAHPELGDVATEDLQDASDLFVAMVAGGSTLLADFGVYRTPEQEARHIDAAVTLYLNGVLPRG
jgi:TetR/AcrR family transcriptional regulator, mexJK operon transcriptional repressor